MRWECLVGRGLDLWYKRIYHTLHKKRQFTNCFNKISRQNLYYWLYKWVRCSIYRITKVFRGQLEFLAIHDYILWKKFCAIMASRIYGICKFARTHFLRRSSSVVTPHSSNSTASYKMQTMKALDEHSCRTSIPVGRAFLSGEHSCSERKGGTGPAHSSLSFASFGEPLLRWNQGFILTLPQNFRMS